MSEVSGALQSSLSPVMDDIFNSNRALLSISGCLSGAEQLGGAQRLGQNCHVGRGGGKRSSAAMVG